MCEPEESHIYIFILVFVKLFDSYNWIFIIGCQCKWYMSENISNGNLKVEMEDILHYICKTGGGWNQFQPSGLCVPNVTFKRF